MYEESCLARDGIESYHIPEKPGLHGACVAVSGESGGRGVVLLFGDFTGLVNGAIGEVDVVVEVRYIKCSAFH